MNNPKSVSEEEFKQAQLILSKVIVDNAEGKLVINSYELVKALREGIQEGRRQEVERAKNYLKRLCWNDKDIELFEKWQSRNEGSEKHGE